VNTNYLISDEATNHVTGGNPYNVGSLAAIAVLGLASLPVIYHTFKNIAKGKYLKAAGTFLGGATVISLLLVLASTKWENHRSVIQCAGDWVASKIGDSDTGLKLVKSENAIKFTGGFTDVLSGIGSTITGLGSKAIDKVITFDM